MARQLLIIGQETLMSIHKFALPAVIAAGGLLFCTSLSYGKPEYTKATKKTCNFCHVNAKSKPKELTEAGKYYQKNKSLEGYEKK